MKQIVNRAEIRENGKVKSIIQQNYIKIAKKEKAQDSGCTGAITAIISGFFFGEKYSRLQR